MSDWFVVNVVAAPTLRHDIGFTPAKLDWPPS
jgi:hypothetical protein